MAQETLEELVQRVREKRKAALERTRAPVANKGYDPTDDEIERSVRAVSEQIPATRGEYAKHVTSSLLSGFTQGIGAMVKGPAVASATQINLAARSLGLPEVPATANPLYKIGNALGGIGEAIVPPQESVRREGKTAKFLAEDLPSGLGSIASFLVPGGIVGKVAGAAEMGPAAASRLAAATAGVLGGTQQVGSVYDDMIARGRSEEEASTAAMLNFGVGATEAVPLGHMMGRLIRGSWGHYIKDALVEGSEEAIQSLFQQGAQNYIEKNVTDEDIDLMSGVLESGEAGGASAILASILTSAIAGKPGMQRGGSLKPKKPGTLGPEPFPMPGPTPFANDVPRKQVDPRLLSKPEMDLVRSVSYDPEAPISVVEPETPLEHAMSQFAQKQGGKILYAMPGENYKGKIQGKYDPATRTALIMVSPKGDSKTWSVFLHEFAGHDFATSMQDVAPDAAREFMTELMTTHREELNTHIKDYFADEAAARGLKEPRFTGIVGSNRAAIEEGLAHLTEMSPIYMHMAFSSPENVRRLLEGKSRTVFHAMFDAVIRSLRGVFGVNLSTTYEKEIQKLEEANAAVSGYEALDPSARLALADRIFSGMEAIRQRRPVQEPATPAQEETQPAQQEHAATAPGEPKQDVRPEEKPVPLDHLTAVGTGQEPTLTQEKEPDFKPPKPVEEPEPRGIKVTRGPASEQEIAPVSPGGAAQEGEKTKRKVFPLRKGGKTFRPVFESRVDEALYALAYGNAPKDAQELRAWLHDQGVTTDREFAVRSGDVLAKVREMADEAMLRQEPGGELQIPSVSEASLKEGGIGEQAAKAVQTLDAWYTQVRRSVADMDDQKVIALIDRAYQNARTDIEAGRVEPDSVHEFANEELRAVSEGQGTEVEQEKLDLGEQVSELIEDSGGGVSGRDQYHDGFTILKIRNADKAKYSLSYAPRQDHPRFVKDDQFIPGDTVRWTESLYDQTTKAKVGEQTITGVITKAVVGEGPITYGIQVKDSDSEDIKPDMIVNRSSRALRLSMAERAAVHDEIARKKYADSMREKPKFSYQKRETGEQPGFMERVDETLFDEMRVWRDLVKKYGPEARFDPSLRETQYYGRGATKLDQIKAVRVGLEKEAAKRGIDAWDSTEENPSLGDALLARHAPEANMYITHTQDPTGEIFRGMGSGMSNASAQDIMRRIRNSPNKDFYDKLFTEVDKVVNKGLERVTKAGIITERAARDWRKKFEHYVPLLTIFEPDHSLPRPGTGFQPSATVTKARRGRKTLPSNPFVSVFQQANRRVVMSEKNRIMTAAAGFVRQFADKARWTIHDRRETLDLRAVQENRVVRFFEDGKEHWIEFANARHAAALLRTNVMYGSEWLKKLSWVSRAYMSLYTRWNPFFPFTNFPRDLQQAGLNSYVENPKGFIKSIRKNIMPAMKLAWKLSRDPTLKGAEYDEVRTWMNLGGRTGYIFTEDWINLAKTVDRDMKVYAGKGPGSGLARGFINMMSLIDDANDAAEAATRYAVYRAALEHGMTKDQATVLSKEITVNFNRQGRWGPAIKAAYFFGNPSLQGLKRYFQTLTSKKGLAVSSGMVGMGFVMSMLNRALADDDEDGENSWQSRSSWEKARYLRLQIPGTTMAVGPPLPWGFNVPYYLGVQLEHTLAGHEKPQKAIADLFGEALDSMNPIGGANLVQAAFPSLLRPAVELTQNQDAFGRPIYPPESPWDTGATPDYERHFQSIMPGWKVMAKAMSDVTGGDSVKPGFVDVSPESLEHLGSFFIGGLGKGMLNTATDLSDLLNSRPVRIRKVPVLSAYLSESYEGGPQMRFHGHLQEIEKAAATKTRALDVGEPEDVKDFLESKEGHVAGLSKEASRAKILYKKAREARDAAKTPAQRQAAEARMHMIERSVRSALQAVAGGA